MPKINLHDELSRALRYDERGEITEAVACLDGIVPFLPEDSAYQKFVGQLYQRLGEDEKSLTLIMAAVEQTPTILIFTSVLDTTILIIPCWRLQQKTSTQPSGWIRR